MVSPCSRTALENVLDRVPASDDRVFSGPRCHHLLVLDLPFEHPTHQTARDPGRGVRIEPGVHECRGIFDGVYDRAASPKAAPALPGEGGHDDHEDGTEHRTTDDRIHTEIVPAGSGR